MQFAAAILLTVGLIASPIGCLIQACELSRAGHDCCPRTASLTACPYDILSSAKAAPSQVAAIVIDTTEPLVLPQPAPLQMVAPVLADQSSLHIENRILRL
jgi:hypothetical protein